MNYYFVFFICTTAAGNILMPYRRESFTKAMALLNILTCIALPSNDLLPYVVVYLTAHANNPLNSPLYEEAAALAAEALDHLSRLKVCTGRRTVIDH